MPHDRSSVILHRQAHPRAGFTMIELLVVVSIIVALMATFAAVGFNITRKDALIGTCKLQVTNIAAAAEQYKPQEISSGGITISFASAATASAWSPNQTYNVGDLRRRNSGWTAGTPYAYVVTAATGTRKSGGTEPSWPVVPGLTQVDNELVWTCCREGQPRKIEAKGAVIWDLPFTPGDIATRDGILDGRYLKNPVTGAWVLASTVYPGYTGFVGLTGYNHKDSERWFFDHDNNAGTPDIDSGCLMDPWGNPYRITIYEVTDTATFGNPPRNPFGSRRYGIWSLGPDKTANTADDIKSWE